MQTVDFTKPQKSGYLENKTFFFSLRPSLLQKWALTKAEGCIVIEYYQFLNTFIKIYIYKYLYRCV